MAEPPQRWAPPSYFSINDVAFLNDRRETIEAIRAESALMQGRVLLQVKRRFNKDQKLEEWFYPWAMEACGVTTRLKVQSLVAVAEAAEDNPAVIEALDKGALNTVYRTLGLPKKIINSVLKKIAEGETFTNTDFKEINALPEVELLKAEQHVDELDALVTKWKLRKLQLDVGTTEYNLANKNLRRNNTKLEKAKAKMNELRERNESLTVKMTAQEAVMRQLSRQLNEATVRYEQATQDPMGFLNRTKAKAVVEAERALSEAIASVERLSGDVPPDTRRSLQMKLAKLNASLTNLNQETYT